MNNDKLIVYFSYTGNTKMIAEKIKAELNADILELRPVIPYSSDYDKVVNDEQNQEASDYLPQIEKINVDLSKYNKIILGFPTWWYRPCPVVRTFIQNNDLTGKIIIPFATNAGWLRKKF